MGKFTAEVSARIAAIKNARRVIFQESAQRTIEIMQTPGPSVANPSGGRGGAMPVDTGFLRASLQASLKGVPTARARPTGDAKYKYDPGETSLVIAGADVNDTIIAAYTANYAKFVNYRYQFVGLAAQRWTQTVREVEAEAARRLKL